VIETARLFKALADGTRLKILWLLLNRRELCVCDIMDILQITQSRASRHLITLRHAGLVTDRREGLWSHYSLAPIDGEAASLPREVLRSILASRPEAPALLRGLRERGFHRVHEA
jgi:ArsR family transcriptional regulator